MTTIYPNAGVVFKIKEILNTVLNGADLTGINSYDPEEVLNMIFDEANAAIKIGIIGGTPTVDGFTVLNGTVPATPDAGYVVLWVDSSDKHVKTVDDTGLVVDLTVAVATDYTLTGTPGTPSAGDYREYYDLDGIKHVLDENGDEVTYNVAEVESGSIGSVAVVEDVQSKIYMEAFAKTFDKNALLRDGDLQTETADEVTHGDVNAVAVDDVCLCVTRVESNAKADIWQPFASYASSSKLGIGTSISAGADGNYYWLITAISGATNLTKTYSGDASAIVYELEVFNLTSLGTLTADQVLSINALATAYGWTITGTLSTSTRWDAIASTWMTTSADRDEFFAIAIPSHVSGMEPAILDEVVNRGGNLAWVDESTVEDDVVYASGGGLIAATGFTSSVNYDPIPTDSTLTISNFASTGAFAYVLYDVDKNYISRAYLGQPHAVTFYNIDTTGAHYIRLSYQGDLRFMPLQLNAGSVANTYSTPLNEVLKFGSRSENQLPLLTMQKWVPFSGGFSTSQTGDDITITINGANAGKQYSLPAYGGILTLYGKIKKGTGVSLRYGVRGSADISSYVTDLGGDIALTDATVEQYFNSTNGAGYDEVAMTFNIGQATADGISAIKIEVRGIGSDTHTFGASLLQLIKGEYTLAQLQAKGYVSYEPIDLLSCPNNAGTSTVRDRAFESNGEIWLEQNVQRNAGYTKHGDPYLNPTPVLSEALTANQGSLDANVRVTVSNDTVATELCTKVVIDGTASNNHYLSDVDGTSYFVVGQRFKVLADIYIPSGQLFSQLATGISINNASSTTVNARADFITPTPDAWQLQIELCDQIFTAASVGRDLMINMAQGGTVSISGDSSAYFAIKNIAVIAYNIQENLAPTLENLSEKGLVISGSLNQGSDVGQNHIVQSGGVEFGITVYKGLGAIIKDVNENVKQKLDKDEQRLDYQVKVITPPLVNGESTVFLYTEFNAVNPKFPVSIPDAFVKASVMGDSDITAVAFDNALVIVATGGSADDIESSVLIGSAIAPVTLDKSA